MCAVSDRKGLQRNEGRAARSHGLTPETNRGDISNEKNVFVCFLMGSILLLSGNAFALTINFATGQDSGGAIPTTGDSQDANWTATYTTTVPTYVTSFAVMRTGMGIGVTSSSSNCSSIAPYPDNAYGNGNYFNASTFNFL